MSNIQHEDFGDFIEDRRKELGLSIPELAQRLGYKNIGNGCQRYRHFAAGTAHELMSFFAWDSINEAERYTRESNRRQIALNNVKER